MDQSKHLVVFVVDFGGQYNQLIARRVREAGIYSEIIPYHQALAAAKARKPAALIFTGGPSSTLDDNAPKIEDEIFYLGIPVLGICYGAQLMTLTLGGAIEKPVKREYGKTYITYHDDSILFDGLDAENICWMSHTDQIKNVPEGFKVAAHTADCPVAAMENQALKMFAVQLHPEVEHTVDGYKIIRNFLYKGCGLKPDWSSDSFIEEKIQEIRALVGDKKVLCALSGGVDSSVAAVLVHKAVGDQLHCIFVDHGLLRKNEGDDVERIFRQTFKINLTRVNAEDRFLSKLAGITDPEQKRKIIGEEFIRVFEEEASKLGAID